MASQLLVDLYDCDEHLLNDAEVVSRVAREAVESIGAQIVKECVHKFQPIGVSYIAVITTSHFSIHTWPENRYAAIDIFSCVEQVPEALAQQLKEAFHAQEMKVSTVVREIGRR